MSGPFAKYGAALIQRGYRIVPIKRGEKRPTDKAWQDMRLDAEEFRDIAASHNGSGVGILTRFTPAIDVDVLDVSVSAAMASFIRKTIGNAPMRIGRAPKCLFIFRTDEPFTKMTSASYIDPSLPTPADGKPVKQRIEILCDGQQFVAYHVHPDTGKPYVWPGYEQEPLDVESEDLIELTVDDAQAVCDEFERIAERMNWLKAGDGTVGSTVAEGGEMLLETPPDEEDDEIARVKSALAAINADCSRETYLRILMALKWTNWEAGEEIARAWAESAPNAYEEKAFNHDWKTVKADRGNRNTTTLGSIYHIAKQAGWDSARPKQEVPIEELRATQATFLEKAKALLAEDAAGATALLRELRDAEIDTLTHETILGAISKATKISLGAIKKAFVETRLADEGLPTHATYAKKLAADIEDTSGVSAIAVEGKIFTFDSSRGVWNGRIPDEMSIKVAKMFDGGDNCERRNDYISIAKHLHDQLSIGNEEFFNDAPHGMGCESRFYSIDSEGNIVKEPLAARHRQRTLFPVKPKVGSMEMFTRFLDQTFAGDSNEDQRNLVQEFIGATMLGFFYKQEKVVLFKGVGRSGKGTLTKIIEALIPRSITGSIPPVKWSHEYYLAGLAGLRLNNVGEIEEEGAIDGAVLKTVTGRDSLSGRHPTQMPFQFKNTASHLFNGNYFPPTRDQSESFFDRWILVEFRNGLIEQAEKIDQNLAQKIIDSELSAIAAWALQGAVRLLERGNHVVLPAEHYKLMDQWRKRSNSVVEFLLDRDEVRIGEGKNFSTRRSNLYPAYAQWCRESGRKALGKQKVYELIGTPAISKLGISMGITHGVEMIRGLMLRQGAFFDVEDDEF